MCDSRPYNTKSSSPGTLAMQASGDGFWEIDLSDGSAWFSGWFCDRLGWTESAGRAAFNDLRPFLCAEAWDSLLRAMRSHLEERTPLEAQFQVQLAVDRIEWWQLRGVAQRNDRGHPTHFAGSVRAMTAPRANSESLSAT
jgi:PAS domain-containing protein